MGLEGRLISDRLAAAAGCSVLLSVDVVIVSLSSVYHNIYALLLLTQSDAYSVDWNSKSEKSVVLRLPTQSALSWLECHQTVTRHHRGSKSSTSGYCDVIGWWRGKLLSSIILLHSSTTAVDGEWPLITRSVDKRISKLLEHGSTCIRRDYWMFLDIPYMHMMCTRLILTAQIGVVAVATANVFKEGLWYRSVLVLGGFSPFLFVFSCSSCYYAITFLCLMLCSMLFIYISYYYYTSTG